MTSRLRSAGPALSILAGVSAALWIGFPSAATPASAWPDDRGPVQPPRHHHRPAYPTAGPLPQPAIVSGYLPRNNNLPMYNEPPPRGPAR